MLLFSGTTFAARRRRAVGRAGRVARRGVVPAPGPVWRDMMDLYFPNSGWLMVSRDTLDALTRFKAARGAAHLGSRGGAAPQGSRGGGSVTSTTDRFAAAPCRRRRGALRGLRALPVPRVGAEEPDALAVRRARAGRLRGGDRLRTLDVPDRMRGRPRRRPARRRCGCGACRCSAASVEARRPTEADFAGVAELDVDGERFVPWEEAVEHELDVADIAALPASPTSNGPSTRHLAGSDDGRGAARRRRAGRGPRCAGGVSRSTRSCASRADWADTLGIHIKVVVEVENVTGWSEPDAPRDVAMRHSLVAVHTLLAVDDGDVRLAARPE